MRYLLIIPFVAAVALAQSTSVTVPRARDQGTKFLELKCGESLTANRTLNFVVGDADKTFNLNTPTFTSGTFSNATEGTGFLFLRGPNYGTSYSYKGISLGTAAPFVISTKMSGSNNQGMGLDGGGWPSRPDRVWFWGYNLDPNGTGQQALQSGEIGFFYRIEDDWQDDNDETNGTLLTPTCTAVGNGNTYVDCAACTNGGGAGFMTGSSLANGDYLWFHPTNEYYRILSWVNSGRVIVEGDATSHSGENADVVVRNWEHHVGPVWPDGSSVRMLALQGKCDRKELRVDWQADKFNWFDSSNTQIFSLDTRLNGGLIWDKNSTYLIMKKSTGPRTNIIGISGSDAIVIGDGNSLPVTLNGSLTLATSGETITSGNLTLSDGVVSQTKTFTTAGTGYASTVSFTGSGSNLIIPRCLTASVTDSGTATTRKNIAIQITEALTTSPTSSSNNVGIQLAYGKTTAGFSTGNHLFVGVSAYPTDNQTHTGGALQFVDFLAGYPSPVQTHTGAGSVAEIGLMSAKDCMLASGKKLILEGTAAVSQPTAPSLATVGDSYLDFSTTGSNRIEVAVDNTVRAYVDSTGLVIPNAGNGLLIKEGSNAKMGTATLSGGAATVSNTSVTASSRIFLTSNADGGTPGWLRVDTRSAGTSFHIQSSSASDTSTVAWVILEPAP